MANMAVSANDPVRAEGRVYDSLASAEYSADGRVKTRSMSHHPDVISPAHSSQKPHSLEPPSSPRSHSDAHSQASVLSPLVSAHSPRSSQPSLQQCSREQEDMLGSLVDTLSPKKMAKLLAAFSIAPPDLLSSGVAAPSGTPPHSTSGGGQGPTSKQSAASVEADRRMAADVAAAEAAMSRVDDVARVLSPSSRATAQANLLCAEEAARAHDLNARGDDFAARQKHAGLQQKVTALRDQQRRAADAQLRLASELAQATAASEAASDDVARISEAGAVRRAEHVDAVKLRREVVASMPAPVVPGKVAGGGLRFAAGVAPVSPAHATDARGFSVQHRPGSSAVPSSGADADAGRYRVELGEGVTIHKSPFNTFHHSVTPHPPAPYQHVHHPYQQPSSLAAPVPPPPRGYAQALTASSGPVARHTPPVPPSHHGAYGQAPPPLLKVYTCFRS